jgi:16S rRNA (uracil1498-N3)-methyltransferase
VTTEPRLFVDPDLHPGATFTLPPAQAHYLGTVLRRGAGDAVILFNGRHGEFRARLTELRKDRAAVEVASELRPQAPETDIWLAFALLKRDATDLVVQKATELGASALLPIITARTNAARVNDSRLIAIATEAAEQSERLTVPILRPPQSLATLLDSWPADRPLFAALERVSETAPLRAVRGKSGLLIGPEGGFAPSELDALRNHPLVTPVQLGSRILRAETACLAGLTLMQAPGCG